MPWSWRVTEDGKRGDKGAMVREDWMPCFIIMLSSSVNTEVCLQRFVFMSCNYYFSIILVYGNH